MIFCPMRGSHILSTICRQTAHEKYCICGDCSNPKVLDEDANSPENIKARNKEGKNG